MRRQTLAILAVAALTLFAGCGGIFGGDSTPAANNTTPTATTTTNTPTTTAQPQDIIGPDNLNTTNIAERHEAALREEKSFSSNITITLKSNDTSSLVSELELHSQYKVNFEQNRAFVTEDGIMGVTKKYTDANATYEQKKYSDSTSDTDAQYEKAEPPYDDGLLTLQPVNRTEAMGLSYVSPDNITFEHMGEETYKGVNVSRWEAHGTDALKNETAVTGEELGDTSAESKSKLKNFSATLLIDDNGLVRYSEMSLTTVEKTTKFNITITGSLSNVGTTPVNEPDWLKYANNSSSSGMFGDDDDSSYCLYSSDVRFDQEPGENGTTVEVTAYSLDDADNLTVKSHDTEYESKVVLSEAGQQASITKLQDGDEVLVIANASDCDKEVIDSYTVR